MAKYKVVKIIKRQVGNRASVIIDEIDLLILEYVNNPKSINNSPKEIGILDLADILKVSHKSLKPHIDKLVKSNLIIKIRNPETKKVKLIGREFLEIDKGIPDWEYDKRSFTEILKQISNNNTYPNISLESNKELNNYKNLTKIMNELNKIKNKIK